MKFYEIDSALQEAVISNDKYIRLKIDIQLDGHYESVFEQDIVEASFFGLKEEAGGTSSRGEITLDNTIGIYSYDSVGAGSEVRISFSLGEGLPFFERFKFYLDDKGIQDVRGSGRKRFVHLSLRDLSYTFRKTDEQRDWMNPAVFAYSVVCDKTQTEKSLVHAIAKRAGLTANDIDCSTIPIELPYIKLSKNIWAELSSLATAYRCHLECAIEKPLVFAHSPYQAEPLFDDDYSYTFTGQDIFYLRIIEKAELYRNSVRLKINMPVALEKQEIWSYDDAPVLYDEQLQKYYPFRDSALREIETGKYEARYRIIENGNERSVVFADDVDLQDEAENRLDYSAGEFSYSHYDVSTHKDRAILTLTRNTEGDLRKTCIHGKPIVFDLNRSCFLHDTDGIENHGTAALNITGSYFSEQEVNGKPQYEDWVFRELAERMKQRHEYTIKTHRALFNARIGAKVKIETIKENYAGVIQEFSFVYKKDSAFVSTFKILKI